MFMTICYLMTASFLAMTVSAASQISPVIATGGHEADDRDWGTDNVDDEWAARALANPEEDRGWTQSCHDEWSDGGESYCEVREYPYDPAGKPIAIRGGQNGGMTVIGWDRDQVRILYRVKGRAPRLERATELAKRVRLETSQGWIRPLGPSRNRGESWSVEIKAWVPRSSDLALRTLNGPVGVRSVRGTMEIESTNGPMSLVDLAGAVYARAQNGPLHVELTGSKWSGAGLDAEAQNGPVNLIIPKNYSARLQTGTNNGPVSIDYALEFQGRIRGQFVTTLGSGGAPVRVVTTNGPFRFSER